MLKRYEMADPKSCLNKAADDEFIFVLRDKDAASPGTIRFWASERVRLGLNRHGDAKILAALAEADHVEAGLARGRQGSGSSQTSGCQPER